MPDETGIGPCTADTATVTAAAPDGASSTARSGLAARILLILALAYSTALIAAGFLVPMYSGSSSSSDGVTEETSDTLVGVNGVNVLIVLAIPLLITIAVGIALRWGTSARRMGLAWTLTGGFAAFTLLAMMSIGVFLLPVVAALVAVDLIVRRQGLRSSDAHPDRSH